MDTQKSLQLRRYPYLPCLNHAAHKSLRKRQKSLLRVFSGCKKHVNGREEGNGHCIANQYCVCKKRAVKNRYYYILWETVKTHRHFVQNIPSDLKNCQRLLMPRDIYDFAFFLWRNASEKKLSKTSILPAKKYYFGDVSAMCEGGMLASTNIWVKYFEVM